MIRIEELKLDITYTEDDLKAAVLKKLKMSEEELLSCRVIRRSIDARKKDQIHYVLTVDVGVPKEKPFLKRFPELFHVDPVKYRFPKPGDRILKNRPVVVGSGPAGLLAAYELSLHGYRPLLLERGYELSERKQALEEFWEKGALNPEANAQFGEGGAGTFSDGKLNTSVFDRSGRNQEVLEVFTRMGANPDILTDARPHIGTDGLFTVLRRLRERIIELGGTVRFRTKVTGIKTDGFSLRGLLLESGEELETNAAIFAIGHSARDTFRMLSSSGINMEAKAFAVGFRVEHPQEMIDRGQYGFSDHTILPAAPYRLRYQTKDGRGVYSFCMCPGGFVLNASSEEKRLCVNGMSYSGRDGKNANSAIVVQVTPRDYGAIAPLDGIKYQEKLEEAAYSLCEGYIPQQLLKDYRSDRPSAGYGDFGSSVKGRVGFANLRRLLPEELSASFLSGMEDFGRKIPGFDGENTILSGIESRTSSPVRIIRDDQGEASIRGIYPAGEGAGYAGGILSAAIDGIRAAEKLAEKYVYKGNNLHAGYHQ